eukprot:361100-Chlamydomonas_euryale.AAC.31
MSTSLAEQDFCTECIQKGIRIDGRGVNDYRWVAARDSPLAAAVSFRTLPLNRHRMHAWCVHGAHAGVNASAHAILRPVSGVARHGFGSRAVRAPI